MAAPPPPPPSGAWFAGVVKAVSSGDQLVIAGKGQGDGAGPERLITLAAIMAPRAGRRDDPHAKDEPYAWQSREFLRQKCIGQAVTFRVEYALSSREFGTVLLGKENVALCVLGAGLARVRLPSGTQLANAAEYQAAEAAARAAARGVWAKGEPPLRHVNDASRDVAKARNLLPFLVRAGRTRAQVEYVISAGRFKLQLSKENAIILFSLAGVRCPRAPEACGDEALAFLRSQLTQRDVDVAVDSVERTGVFMGALFVPTAAGGPASRAPLSLLLVEAGLAYVTSSADARPEGRQLRAAEATARAALKGLWRTYVEPAPAAEADEAPAAETKACVVTDVLGGGHLYVQIRDDAELTRVQAALAAAAHEAGFVPPTGSLCAACFSGDDVWYRAYVVSARGGLFQVYFCDFGNAESLPASRLAPLDASLAAVPPRAHRASLAFVKVPSLEEEGGLEAAQLVSALTAGGRPMVARIESRTKPPGPRHAPNAQPSVCFTLLPADEEGDAAVSVNAALLSAGLARLARPTTARAAAAIDALRPHLEEARRMRRGMFEYGDPADSDDEREAARIEAISSRGRGR